MNRRWTYRLRRGCYRGEDFYIPSPERFETSRVPTEDKQAEEDEKKDQLIKEQQQQYLKLCAESDNFRKRMEREKDAAVKFANEGLIKKLLVVIDDVERALESVKTSGNIEALREGVEIIRNHFWGQMESEGLQRIPTDGQPFDPNLHEAVSTETSEDAKENHIVSTLQPGYMLKDRVIRAAMVSVARK